MTARNSNKEKITLSAIEAAKLLGVGPGTIYKLIEDGTIPVIRLGGTRKLILKETFEKIISEGRFNK